MNYRTCLQTDLPQVLPIALRLWPKQSADYLHRTFCEMLKADHEAVYVAEDDGRIVGFMTLSLRRDYVEGSHSSPVGYLEGIYVETEYRKQGVAKHLVEIGEQWAKSRGCTEMGSDLYLDNRDSLQFHQSLGYTEVGRLIHMIKKL